MISQRDNHVVISVEKLGEIRNNLLKESERSTCCINGILDFYNLIVKQGGCDMEKLFKHESQL